MKVGWTKPGPRRGLWGRCMWRVCGTEQGVWSFSHNFNLCFVHYVSRDHYQSPPLNVRILITIASTLIDATEHCVISQPGSA
jgi:hypothetical protein